MPSKGNRTAYGDLYTTDIVKASLDSSFESRALEMT